MNLAQKLELRASVMEYLKTVDDRAKNAIHDEMSEVEYGEAVKAWADARHNLIRAKSGDSWVKFIAAAKAAGF